MTFLDELLPEAPARRGNRLSLLPISRYCPKAARLSAAHGAGRAAAKSKAFHARAAGQPDAAALWAALDEAEREEVEEWTTPSDVTTPAGATLAYHDAVKELAVGLDADGHYVDEEDPRCIAVGHIDMGWVTVEHGVRVAYVGDIKKSKWTTLEGPTSLQLLAYGVAFASRNECEFFVPGLWIAESSEWQWHTSALPMHGDPLFHEMWEDILAAILNTEGEAVTGAHCRSCYGRLHCEEHVLPAAAASTWLAPVASGQVPSPERARGCLLAIQQAEEVLSKAKENIQEWVRQGKLRIHDPESGMVYRQVQQPGRASLDRKKLIEELGPDVERFMKRGAPFTQFRWLKG